MKSHTNIKESKKLAKILPIETADMICYGIHKGMDGNYHLSGTNTEDDVIFIEKSLCKKVFDSVTDSDIESALPCWSLQSLLDVIDSVITFDDGSEFELHIKKEDIQYYLYYEDSFGVEDSFETELYDNLIDACYEMILKLHHKKVL